MDSGGQGLVYVYEGFLACLKGEDLPEKVVMHSMDDLIDSEHHRSAQGFMNSEDIEFGYCTEFMVKLDPAKLQDETFDESVFRQDLSGFGDSLLVISDDEVVKVHIHTEQPGDALSYGQKYGSLTKMKIDNMREQHSDIMDREDKTTAKPAQHKYAIVTVSMGEGIAELLKSIGASAVIEGGQTMNPSTEDIVKAIQEIGAEKVLILPNNKNIIMAAEQAAEVLEIEAAVVPTKSVPEGLAAILAFNPEATVEKNAQAMQQASSSIKTGQVTFAVRDTTIDGVTIHKDDFMGIAQGKITSSKPSLEEVAKNLISSMIDEEDEIVTIIYGEDVAAEDAEEISSFIEEQFDHVDIELYAGKQPLYPYIISVE